MGEHITHPDETAQSEQVSSPDRTQEQFDAEYAAIVAHAEELGLTPEETKEALEDYAATQETEVAAATQENAQEKELTIDDVIKDPNVLMDSLNNTEGNPLEGIEQSLNKLTEDVDGLAESLRGLGETFNKLMEMLQELVKLLKEIVEMAAERDALETQAAKEDMTRKIQQKVNDFGNKYGG